MNAIILAAGKGERLKPLTDTVPKPLIEVSGKTLLERNINRLFESGVRNIIVNLSHVDNTGLLLPPSPLSPLPCAGPNAGARTGPAGRAAQMDGCS